MFEKIVAFIREIYQTDNFIPLHSPTFSDREKEYLIDCIDTTFVSSVGKYVDRFEETVVAYTGSKYAIAVVNGTSALQLSLLLAGVKREDLVLTQPLTFIATANAITYTGAQPLFLDIDPSTLGLSAEKLEDYLGKQTITDPVTGKRKDKVSGKNISACVPVHIFGHPVQISDIQYICNKYDIVLIEDAAESLGSFFNGRHTGTFGKMGILSFNGNKIITTGGGGMILTDDKELAQRARHLSTQAKVPHPWEYIHDETGFNFRLTNIQAALGVAQMEKLPQLVENKRELAEKYSSFFMDSPYEFLSEPLGARSNYWLNAILLKDKDERDAFLQYTNDRGVMTRPAWRLMPDLEMFRNCRKENIDHAREIADRLVNIPSTPLISFS